MIKLASLAAAMAEELGRRGVGEPAAKLTAETGVAVFKVAFDRWISAARDTDLADVVSDSLDELKALTAGINVALIPTSAGYASTGQAIRSRQVCQTGLRSNPVGNTDSSQTR